MKRLNVLGIILSALAMVLFGAGAAQGGPVEKVTGSVQLSSPMQYVSFNAFEGTPAKGSVNYTNFGLAESGTGVWVPESFSMGFAVGSSSTIVATYAMTVTSFTPTSPTSVAFAGTGDCGCGWVSTFTGHINGSTLHVLMTEINASNPTETYAMTATGTINAAGAVSGTWSDDYGSGRTGTFAVADIGHEVFHYVATVLHANVTGNAATFDYVIPAGVSYAGTPVYVSVSDGGSPGVGNDTWSHNGGSYPVVAGNLTVHS